MVAPHFLQRILTILPRTLSSAIVYLAAQAWHVIFIQPPMVARRSPRVALSAGRVRRCEPPARAVLRVPSVLPAGAAAERPRCARRTSVDQHQLGAVVRAEGGGPLEAAAAGRADLAARRGRLGGRRGRGSRER